MAATSLLIKTTDTSNKAQQKSIPYINPAATDAALKTFAQKLVAMSTDYYGSTTRVDTKNLDTESGESGGTSKTEGTITVGTFSNQQATVTYNGDGTLQLASANNATLTGTTLKVGASGGSGILYAAATDNYTAAVAAF